MKKMKTMLLVCFAMLMGMMAFSMNAPSASAMTISDLQGMYRVQSGSATGSEIRVQLKDGDLVGEIVRLRGINGTFSYWEVGSLYFKDGYVENGKVKVAVLWYNGMHANGYTMSIYNNGATLSIEGPSYKSTLVRI